MGLLKCLKILYCSQESCYSFTWKSGEGGNSGAGNGSTNACGEASTVPCSQTILDSEKYPNPPTKDEIRNNITAGNADDHYICDLDRGETCMKVKLLITSVCCL